MYTLNSNELDVLPLDLVTPGIAPGTYVFNLEVTCGLKKTLTSFTLVIVDPCPTNAVLTIKLPVILPAAVTRNLRDPIVSYTWDPLTVADVTGVSVDCGGLGVTFIKNDGLYTETAPESAVFTDNRSTTPA